MKYKIIPTIEISLGILLLIHEIYQMFHLQSIHDSLYNGLVDFAKYKEETYSLTFLWLMLIFTGVSGWLNDKLYWVFTQILLVTVCVLFFFPIIQVSSTGFGLMIISVLFVIGIIYLETRLYRQELINRLNINSKTKMISISLGLLCSVIYWIIKVKFEV